VYYNGIPEANHYCIWFFVGFYLIDTRFDFVNSCISLLSVPDLEECQGDKSQWQQQNAGLWPIVTIISISH
jgi:hypothetical protein